MSSQERAFTESISDRASEIYLAAAEIIRKKGFDATSMNDIAEAVHLTKAGLYYYTKGKRDLLYMIISFAMEKLEREVVEPALKIHHPVKRLQAVIQNHIRLIVYEGAAITILTEEVDGLAPAKKKKIIQRKRAYFELVRDTLEEIKKSGKLRDLDTTVAAMNVFAIILGIARWHRPDGRIPVEGIVDEISKFIVGGLLVCK